MSYILDAIKKAEQTRQQGSEGSAVAASTAHVQQDTHRPIWIFLLIGIALALALWVFNTSNQWANQQHRVSATMTNIAIAKQPSSTMPMPMATIELSGTSATTLSLLALPQAMRASLPAIAISAHIYSEISQQRTAIINKKVVHEGDYVAENLQLVSITPAGVLLRFHGQMFSMSALDQWPD